MNVVAASAEFGQLVKSWRGQRRVSQLDLALLADISSRHVSFLETGRSRPSREMVQRIAGALDVPLRSRNLLLNAAGFAPVYTELALSDPDMEEALAAVRFLLEQHEPFPAMVLDRLFQMIMANQTAARLFSWLLGPPADVTDAPVDGLDMLLAARPVTANWPEVAVDVATRVRRAAAAAPGDGALAALAERFDQAPALKGLPTFDPTSAARPLVPVRFRKDGIELSFITTVATFGMPQDVTLQELRIESFFPADGETRRYVEGLSDGVNSS